MKKIKLKDGAIIYIDTYNNETAEDGFGIYDSKKRYLDYYQQENGTREDYDNYIKGLEKLNSQSIFELFCNSYDYGNTPQEILHTYIEDISQGQLPNEFSEELKHEIMYTLFDMEFLTDEELCERYDINKIGNLYFRGNW